MLLGRWLGLLADVRDTLILVRVNGFVRTGVIDRSSPAPTVGICHLHWLCTKNDQLASGHRGKDRGVWCIHCGQCAL